MIESIIFLIAAFIAAIAATLAGFGSSTILIPVAVMFMDLKTAIFLVACAHLFNNTFKIKAFWNKINFKVFLLFGIPSIIAAFSGAMLITVVPVEIIKRMLAIFLIVFVVYSFFKPKFAIKQTNTNAIIGGSLSGLLAGVIGLGGAIRSAFLIVFNLPKEVYIATSAAIAFVVDITRIPTYMFSGIVQDSSYYVLLPFLLLCAFFGVKTGKALLGKISQDTFRRVVLVALLLVSLKLIF